MKNIICGTLLSVSMLLSCASVQAATDINNTSVITFNGPSSTIGASYGTGTTGQSFTENFTFGQSTLFNVSSAVISIALSTMSGLNITSFTLTGNGLTAVGSLATSAGLQTWTLSASNLTSGLYTLSAVGTVTGTAGGSFGGNISVTAVPEASTTAMMLGGLALVGLIAARKRRQSRINVNGGRNAGLGGMMPA